MDNENAVQELLEFFKTLADANRLKMVGLLAQGPYTGEQLAAMVGIAESTASHHLAKLVQAGLVTARAQGYYSIYTLETAAVEEKARRLLSQVELPKLAADADLAAFDRKVLNIFTDEQGRIKQFPVQQNKFQVLLRYVVKAFEPGIRYPEPEVNHILSRYSEDTARLRRGLVEYGLMAREGGGGAYWRTNGAAAGDAAHAG